MKKKSLKKSLTHVEKSQLSLDQVKSIKGGTSDNTDDIIIVDIISP